MERLCAGGVPSGRRVGSALLTVLLLAGIAGTAPATVGAASSSIAPAADAYVRGGTSATRNFGSATTVWLRSDSGTANDGEGYLRFDLAGAGAWTTATLRLTPTSVSFASRLTVRARLVVDAGDGWSETAITHATRPADLAASVTLAGSTLAAGRAATIDVTSLLAQEENANGVATIHLDLSSPDGKPQVSFASREHATAAYRPTLVLASADPNRAPVAGADTATVVRDTATTVAVLANDADPDADPLAILSVTAPAHGSASIVSGGIRYVPGAGYTGTDTFSYTIGDGRGGTATGAVGVTVVPPGSGAADPWPSRYFAPYVDATGWPTYDLTGSARTSGVRYYTLGFIVADASNAPSWGGYYTAASGWMLADIANLRALGGDVAVSFGGAAGTELALRLTDTTALTAAYQSVIDRYALTHVDFDIEGSSLGDAASVNRRNDAIARLQAAARAAGRPLVVSYTLPVLPTGLTTAGRSLVASALARGVTIDSVNVMAMDYGSGAAPNPDGQMGKYAIDAATSTHAQLRTLYANAGQARTDAELWRLVAVTPMIGVNDVTTEIFRPADAVQLRDFAISKDLRWLSFWSAARDRPATASQAGQVSGSHCGLTDVAPFAFSTILVPFTGASTPTLSIADATVAEGDAGSVSATFAVTIVPAPTSPVSVAWSTGGGSATPGSDYAAASGTLAFAAGQTSATIAIAVAGDAVDESTETFGVSLVPPAGLAVGRVSATGTITDDDGAVAAVTWQVTDDWGSGFGARVTITNVSTTAWETWTVAFDLPRTITSIWDADIVSVASGRYTVRGKSWNLVVAPGASVSFGFNGTTGSPPAPTNWTLNGQPL
ncbi:MAG: hypothetical protein RL338_56 [Chloroflexota bacterium]